MKIELIKYVTDEGKTFWKILKDGAYITCYLTEEEAIEGFDKLVIRLQEPKIEDQIIKSVTI